MPHAVFFLSTGRCGTQWCASQFRETYGDLADVTHEPILAHYRPKDFFRAYDRLDKMLAIPRVAQHFERIAARKQEKIYIETGWPSFAAVPLFIRRLEGDVRLVHLYRHPVTTAMSLVTQNYYSPDRRNDIFTRFGELIPSPASFQEEYTARWPQMNAYEKCIYFWTEVNLYALELKKRFTDVPFYSMKSEDLLQGPPESLQALTAFLGLPYREKLAEGRSSRVDQYNFQTDREIDWRQFFNHPRAVELAKELGYDLEQHSAAELDQRYRGERTAPVRGASLPAKPTIASQALRHVTRSTGAALRVLMVNAPSATKFRGGDSTQMRKTAEALRGLGVEVEESFEPQPNTAGFDIAHVFNLRTVGATMRQVRHLKSAGIPIVMSPIYLNPSRALWASRAIISIFGRNRREDKRREMLDQFRKYSLVVPSGKRGGGEWSAHTDNRSTVGYDEAEKRILQNVRYLLPNSMLEMNALMKTLRVFDLPFSVVPYAADAKLFLDADPKPFVKKHRIQNFILQVGRVESSKNQLMLLYALRDLKLPVVLIGGLLQKQYAQWCRAFGTRNVRYIPHMPVEELRSAYAAAHVHALPSWIETCGLVTMEAALANCNVVCSNAGFEVEYYRDLAYYCDPADPDSIRRAVVKAMRNYPADAPRRDTLKRLILSEYTWERAAKLTYDAYRKVLGEKS